MKVKSNKKNVDKNKDSQKMIFSKMNYILFFIGLAVIAIAFLLMLGGGSNDPDVFNEKMFNFQRLTLSPILLIIGFIVEFFAIFYKGKK